MTLPKLPVKVEGNITIGNVVSWAMIAFGLVAGYTKLQDASAQNTKDVAESKALALSVSDKLNESDKRRDREISEIKTDVAVIKANVLTMSVTLQEIRDNQRK
jgi:hypothetical protein